MPESLNVLKWIKVMKDRGHTPIMNGDRIATALDVLCVIGPHVGIVNKTQRKL